MGDYWLVTSASQMGERAALRFKKHSHLYRWIAHLAIPLMIFLPCAVGEMLLPCPWLATLGAVAAVVAGIPLYLLRRQEFLFVDSQPQDVFLLMTDGSMIVHGEKLDIARSCEKYLEHRYYTPTEDSSSFSELDLVIVNGDAETRYQLLSGARSLKHGKRLSSACNFDLRRKKIAAG